MNSKNISVFYWCIPTHLQREGQEYMPAILSLWAVPCCDNPLLEYKAFPSSILPTVSTTSIKILDRFSFQSKWAWEARLLSIFSASSKNNSHLMRLLAVNISTCQKYFIQGRKFNHQRFLQFNSKHNPIKCTRQRV